MRFLVILFSVVFLFACNNLKTGNSLSNADVARVQKLYALDKDEKIEKFYSEFENEVAGNFFTNKRLAKYWIDKNDSTKTEVSFALYKEIKSIDTIYNAGATYCPYMLVTKNNDSQFKVCVDGKREDVKAFFEEALSKWKVSKN